MMKYGAKFDLLKSNTELRTTADRNVLIIQGDF